MPDNNTAAQWAAATELMGQGINAWSAAQTNKKQRQWQEMMYAKQRQDALADWTMQNEYNDPKQQMARLKEAGLNPALIYGSGSATAMSTQAVRSSSPGQWTPKAPTVEPSGIITSYFNQKMQEASIRNLDTKNTVLLADAAKKAGELDKLRIDTMKSQSQIKSTDQMTAQRTSLLPILMEQIKANIERTGGQTAVLKSDKLLKDAEKLKVEADTAKSQAERKVILARNVREAQMQSYNISEAVARTLNLKQAEATSETQQHHYNELRKLAEQDIEIKKLDRKFLEEGHRNNDNWFFRQVEDVIRKLESMKLQPKKPAGKMSEQTVF